MKDFFRTLGQTIARNPISAFAILCVAAIGFYLSQITNRMLSVLESANWCVTAIKAEKASAEQGGGASTCLKIMELQLSAVGDGFRISTSGYVFMLVVLIVVVVAGARANFKLGANGIEGDVSRDAAAGAEHVRDAADEAAAEVGARP